MRLSTNQMFNANVAGYQKGYAELIKTQEQVTSGNRIQTPADDPVGAARLLQLEEQQSLLEQYRNNLTDATNALTQEESILTTMITISQRARELTVQAGNGAYGDHDRKSIAQELEQIEAQLFSMMNSKDASGDYWFSGSQSGTQPYVRNGDGSYSYQGDENQRFLQVATGMQISMGDSGHDAFESAKNVRRTETKLETPGPEGQRMYLSQGTVSVRRDFDDKFRADAPYELRVSLDGATETLNYQMFKDGIAVEGEDAFGIYDPTAENPKISFRGVEFSLDTVLKSGESTADLVAHSFEINMAPDNFVVTGSSAAKIVASSVTNAGQYAAGYPAGGLTLTFDGTGFIASTPNGTQISGGVTYDTVAGTVDIPDAGVAFTLTGTPASGDQFKISADSNETQNILNTIAELRKSLEEPADGIEGGGLRIREAIAVALGNIDSGMIQIESTQAHIGARLNSIDTLIIENESMGILNATTQSAIRDTDEFEAIPRMILQQTKLEAAMAAFVRVSQLSLFDRM